MPMQAMKLSFPLQGIDDRLSYEEQRPMTTREGVNVRGVDPRTGRVRGSKRAGLTRFVSGIVYDATGAPPGEHTAVRELVALKFDSRKTDYTAVTQTPTPNEWAVVTPSDDDARRVVVDRQGNVICLDGPSGVAVYNPEGELLGHYEIPLEDSRQRVRALEVGRTDEIYTGITKTPRNAKGKIYRHSRDEEGDFTMDWSVSLDGVCQDLRARGGLLYVLENIPDSGKISDGVPEDGTGTARVRIYDSLDASSPREIGRFFVPYPSSGIDVDAAGAIFVACFPNTERKIETSDCSTPSVGWSPVELPDWDEMKWGWWDARKIENVPPNTEIRVWEDRTYQGRDLLYSDSEGPTKDHNPPILNPAGLCNNQTVEFDGSAALATILTGTTADDQTRGSAENLSMVPSFDLASYTIAFLVVPEASTDERNILYFQEGNYDIWFVANEGNPRTVAESGKIRLTATRAHVSNAARNGDLLSAPSSLDGNRPEAGDFIQSVIVGQSNLRRDTALIVFRHGGDDVVEASRFRVNGADVDVFTMNRERSTNPSVLGHLDPNNKGDITNDGDEPPDYSGFVGHVAEIITIRDLKTANGDSKDRSITDAEIEKLEGYLAHRWGVQHNLDAAHPYKSSPPPGNGEPSDPTPSSSIWEYSGGQEELASIYGIVIKYGPGGGSIHWAFTGSGVGYGVVVSDAGNVYSWGTGPDEAGATYSVRQLIDDGDTYSEGWKILPGTVPVPTYPVKAAVDAEENLYLPVHEISDKRHLVKIKSDGTIEWDIGLNSGATKKGYDVALDRRSPDYNDSTIGEPEFIYTVKWQRGPGSGYKTLRKYRTVGSSPETGAVRDVHYIAVAGGDVRRLDPDADTVTTVTDGTDALSGLSQWTRAVALFGEVFITDGEKMVVYNPRDGAVKDYKPRTGGEFLRRPRLLEAWRGRLVGARSDDEPHNWMMTRAGDPYDVDLFPPFQTQEMAVKGNQSPLGPGICPDIVNCLMPIDDDLLIFGCDQSIYRLTGDPAAGGVFDLVTDITGVAFGRAWCKDPQGIVYFFGSEGGVYQWNPRGGVPVSLTEQRIDARMKSIDLSQFSVRMAWDHRQRGIHILLVPIYAPSATSLTHYFWERETGAFWEVSFADTGLEPTCLAVFDGDDPSDRVIAMGCADGYVRRWDENATTDDTHPIDARVLFGPYSADPATRLLWTGFEFKLATEGDGAYYELLGSDSADTLPDVAPVSGSLRPGRNPPILERVSGQSMWVRLRSGGTGFWAYESGVAHFAPAGIIRSP